MKSKRKKKNVFAMCKWLVGLGYLILVVTVGMQTYSRDDRQTIN